jgi:Cdc6-like AAA superfamily ATPase
VEQSELFETIRLNLQPEKPIRSVEFLRGRAKEFELTVRELQHFDGIPFVFGHRGVGETSLARTAAQMATASDREHVYVACAPESTMLEIFREVGEGMLSLAIRFGAKKTLKEKFEVQVSLNPYIKASIENEIPELEEFKDVNQAVRILKSLDEILPGSRNTVVVVDELEELNQDDRNALAFLIKQIGDQEFSARFLLVGIAENVHELLGAHESVPRYITEVPLQPLIAQSLIDIVADAARALGVRISKDILYRIAIIGNGFPYYAHLLGKTLLVEAVLDDSDEISNEIYSRGIKQAVSQSLQELKVSYEAAIQRGEDYFKHMIWTLADFDLVDIRVDDWKNHYYELARKFSWGSTEEKKFSNASNNMRGESYGNIIRITPAKYGSAETRYRFRRCNYSGALARQQLRRVSSCHA